MQDDRTSTTERPTHGAEAGSGEPQQPEGLAGVPTREKFLQHALGTQGDVSVAAVLLSLAALLAVVAVGWKKLRARRRGRSETT